MSNSPYLDLRRQFAAPTAAATPPLLRLGEVSLPTHSGRLPAFQGCPATPGPHPLVLVVHDREGLNETTREWVRRLAALGCLALAPALTFRHLPQDLVPGRKGLPILVEGRLPDAQVLSDLDACLAWAGQQGADLQRSALCGWGWGGRMAWLYAAHQPQLRAAVAWSGPLTGATSVFQPRHPVDVVPVLKFPVLGLYGDQDSQTPLTQIQQHHVQLRLHGGGSKLHVYRDTPHAFHAEGRKAYRASAALDAWQRMLAWWQAHGAGPYPLDVEEESSP